MRKGTLIPLETAERAIVQDVRAFRLWWESRPDLGLSRPSIEEWFAEYWEWRMRPR